ncbi:2,3-diphosphoglycerate-dependent phosphoglycerate mutase [Picrophilus oshimae]|uniref:Phosphoglycerate mutase/fructose-2,6-bisphosphatase n=1 Tax=Picrophilus torridus (strain ATCC 700027 / DSM 9790 / JCM 10055 / NBRC 100828 / KAW 2/3) TaxID=1122961 RepID=Q6KZ44_PICTO|nr:2,3-diphosphoglycerate-dependent phosphoglycerate mutase [Picrophilus oshimae]AAT44008.1 phosphoglycerate mutase/fructose-2,6-bisphosphatase [Picrophilus oshimae DSM 9789]
MEYVILVRHGESMTNRSGILSREMNKYGLTDNGIEQAKFTAYQLKSMNFDMIISSPVLRARETARIIANETNLKLKIDDRAIESDFGQYEGMHINEIPMKPREELGMETFESQQARMIDLIDSYNGRCIIVSHAFPIRAAISYYLDMDEQESFGIEIRYASMSAIDVKNKRILSIGSLLITDRIKKRFS